MKMITCRCLSGVLNIMAVISSLKAGETLAPHVQSNPRTQLYCPTLNIYNLQHKIENKNVIGSGNKSTVHKMHPGTAYNVTICKVRLLIHFSVTYKEYSKSQVNL